MPTDSAQSAAAPPAGKPGMAKAGKIVIIVSLIVLVLPFAMLLAGILGQMAWLQFADTTKPPPFLIEALPWSLIFAPLTVPAGIVGVIIGWLLRRFARKG